MRLALLLVLALSACASKKQAPRSPASPAAPAAEEKKEETGAKNVDSDKDADDPKPLSSDPEEGGQ